jgi:hypothetical protein
VIGRDGGGGAVSGGAPGRDERHVAAALGPAETGPVVVRALVPGEVQHTVGPERAQHLRDQVEAYRSAWCSELLCPSWRTPGAIHEKRGSLPAWRSLRSVLKPTRSERRDASWRTLS